MNPVLLQKQVRDNAEDLSSYIRDLKCWETEMKRKEKQLVELEVPDLQKNIQEKEQNLPPVRSKKKKTGNKTNKGNDPEVMNTKKIPGFDYASWDRFDVDKACAEVDADVEESEEETESEEDGAEEQLREEAIYEKEKGNQFVKNKKWSEAIVCYTRAIECFAYDAIYYANRALCYLKLDEFQLAETDCSSSLQLDISYVKAYQRRAAARVGLGLLLEAKSDLEMILQLEPMNTSSKIELIKIEKLINSSKVEMLKDTAAGAEMGKTCGEEADVRMSWGSEAGVRLVQPINKPPHLRSKKPLKRIDVQEIGYIIDGGIIPQSPSVAPSSHSSVQVGSGEELIFTKTTTPMVTKEVENEEGIGDTAVERTKEKTAESEELPPRPNSSVEFLVGWKKINTNPNLKYSYLKQIPGVELPNIFQESLESATLSDLISTLAVEFLQRQEPVYGYLVGISNVKRLSALTLFMSAADQDGLKKLLNSSIATGECTEEEATKLRLKFEL